ncbi:MAG: hypothetical protein IJZ88_01365 [Clostridia bacterium]|nr:hypothetical protein [Clostridia bacterium]
MTNNAKKAAKFVSTITAEADARCERIKKGTDKFIDYELKRVRKAAKLNAKAVAKLEVSKLSEQSNTDLYKSRSEMMMQIFSKRDEISNRVFDKVRQGIISFTGSDSYQAFLEKSVKNIVAALGEDTIIFIRPEDEKFAKALAPFCKGVETDKEIVFGGCKGVNNTNSLRADDTLDARFSEQKKEFYATSGLSITGG